MRYNLVVALVEPTLDALVNAGQKVLLIDLLVVLVSPDSMYYQNQIHFFLFISFSPCVPPIHIEVVSFSAYITTFVDSAIPPDETCVFVFARFAGAQFQVGGEFQRLDGR